MNKRLCAQYWGLCFATIMLCTFSCTSEDSPPASHSTRGQSSPSKQQQAAQAKAEPSSQVSSQESVQASGPTRAKPETVANASSREQELDKAVPSSTEPQKAAGNPTEIQYVAAEAYGLYFSELQNDFKEAVDFSCPGDSILIGEKSVFDKEGSSFDRTYRFYCQFMEDGQASPLRKANCELSAKFDGADIAFACPQGKFLSGQKSEYVTAKKDRIYQYECCELRNQNDQLATIKEEETEGGGRLEMCTNDEQKVPTQLRNFMPQMVNIDVNARQEDVDYQCSNAAFLPIGESLQVSFEPVPIKNAILRQVKSHFNLESQDRRHSFYCCQLKVDGP